MKRGIIATIILFTSIVLSSTTNLALQHKIEKLYTLAESATKSPSCFSDFEKEWNKQSLFFSLFTDHSDFEEIGKQIVKAKHLKGEKYTDTFAEITTALVNMKRKLSYSVENVF